MCVRRASREPPKGLRYASRMDLDELARNWDEFGKQDPLWAIRTEPDKRGGKWDVQEFFESGEVHVNELVERLRELGLPIHGTALDFGCGVGRLTQAFAEHYDEVWGVDIAPSMIEGANKFNRHGSRAHYVVNDRSDLQQFDDAFFDLVFSVIVLQHIRPDIALSYVRDFFRICKPDGAVVFQMPSHLVSEALPDGAYAAEISADVPDRMRVGETIGVPVQIRNVSSQTWPLRPDQLRVANHWADRRGRSVQYDSAREPIPIEMPPGAVVDLTLTVPSPPRGGEHVLELDLVHEGVTWFAQRGSKVLRVPVEVDGDGGDDRSRRRIGLRRRAKANDEPVEVDGDGVGGGTKLKEPVMEMHAVHRDEVLAVIEELGGTVVALEPNDNAAPWMSYTYYVTKSRPT
jgi:SAM-dependent methyltransferase